MGFLSFLGRKTPDDRRLDTRLKGQAYGSTQAALPPILGTYPVSGNGENVLAELQQAARKRSLAQLAGSGTVASASPLAPRFPTHTASLASFDMDNVSMQSRPKSAGRKPRDSSRGPSSLLNWASRRNSSHARSEADRDAYVPPPVPRIPDRHRRDGSSSMNSTKRPAFVDLLDAQSHFKASDFRSRVQAAGARDYGEDVAERNLGVNGVDLSSPAVKAFYALTGGAALAYRSDGSAVDVHGNMYNPDNIPVKLKEAAPRPAEANEELEWAIHDARKSSQKRRSVMLDSSSRQTDMSDRRQRSSTTRGPLEAHVLGTRSDHRQSSKTNRRNSLQDFTGTSSSTQSKAQPFHLHPSASRQAGDPASPPGIPRYRPRTAENPSSNRTPSAERFYGSGSNLRSKRHDDHEQSLERNLTHLEPRTTRGRRTASKRAHHNGSSRMVAYAGGDSSDEADISSAPSPGVGSHQRNAEHQNYSRPTTQQSWHTVQGVGAEESSQFLSRPTSSSGQGPYPPRSRSIGGTSMHGRPRLDDIIEHIPVRKSSLVPVNLLSITPTTTASGHSSNQVSHSDSHFTPDTSVDLSFNGSSTSHGRNASSSTANPRPTGGFRYDDDILAEVIAAHRRGKSMGDTRRKPSKAAPTSPNLDDYGSATTDGSDFESFIETHRRKQRGGEGVLTKDLIDRLPGLFDGLDAAGGLRSRNQSGAATQLSSSRSRDALRSRARADRTRAPAYQFSSDDQDSEFQSDVDYHDSFRPSPATLAAFAHQGLDELDLFDLLDDMPDEKMDARTAVKMRKEIKRQKRIAAQERIEGKRPMSRGGQKARADAGY